MLRLIVLLKIVRVVRLNLINCKVIRSVMIGKVMLIILMMSVLREGVSLLMDLICFWRSDFKKFVF